MPLKEKMQHQGRKSHQGRKCYKGRKWNVKVENATPR